MTLQAKHLNFRVGLSILACLMGSFAGLELAATAQSPVLSHDFPHDVELNDPADPKQGDFDTFSWKSFVALNWPAKEDGTPDTDAKIGEKPSAKRVWEFFMHPKDVFLKGGTEPTWMSPAAIGDKLQLTKSSFRGSSLDALNFPVIDQDKNFVVFDIRLNRDVFDYILAEKLYSKAGQNAGSDEKFVRFPSGVKGGVVGAVEIKTGWRVFPKPLANPDQLKRYFTMETKIAIDAAHSSTGTAFEYDVVLGLVAFHIAHKTTGQPQWVWSTFEHVDNLNAPPGGKPSFTDPACAACPPNNKPLPPGEPVPMSPDDPKIAPRTAYLWSPTPPFAGGNQRIPTQIKREIPIKAETNALNHDWQTALAEASPDSVWQHYQLISTQWPTKPFARQAGQLPGTPGQPTFKDFLGDPLPTKLANIPLETFNQKSSSCIKCHARAFTTNGDYADFSYLLQLAQ